MRTGFIAPKGEASPVSLLRSLNRILGYPDRERTREKEKQPGPHSPLTGAERAEERIFDEAKKKAGIVSGYRTRLNVKK